MDDIALMDLDAIAPYPGLRPFKREEAAVFFGRDRCVDAMMMTLQAERFLAVLGPSGSGKSSLVRSGLFPNLEAGLARRAGSRWTFLDIRHPRCRPYRALASVTLSEENRRVGNRTYKLEESSIEQRRAELVRSPEALIDWWQRQSRQDGEKLLLLVDQFEELFGFDTTHDRQEVETFVDLLLHVTAHLDSPIYVVFTMRSEFLSGCSLFPGFAERINNAISLIPRMSRRDCEIAITGPAHGREDFEIEPLLVTTILNDMNTLSAFDREREADHPATAEPEFDQASADRRQADLIASRADQLPLMQHVLNWLLSKAASTGEQPAKITLKDYLAVGGLRGALSTHANDVLGDNAEDIRIAELLFRSITDQPSIASGSAETSAVRRPRRLEQIVQETGVDIDQLSSVIDRFRANGVSMLTPDRFEVLTPHTEIDISHESIIRQWDRLRDWIRKEADAGRGWQELIRSRQEEARRGVLRGIELQDRREWWNRTKPTAGWAERYGGGYDAAAAFLVRSEKLTGRRKMLLYAGTASLLVISVLSGNQILINRNKVAESQQKLDELQNKIAMDELRVKQSLEDARQRMRSAMSGTLQAEAERMRAVAELKLASQQLALARAASKQAQRDKQLADEQVARAKAEAQRISAAAVESAAFGGAMVHTGIDESMKKRPMLNSDDLGFVDYLLKNVENVDPLIGARLRYKRELVRARNAFLNLNIVNLSKAADALEEFSKAETESDWSAAGRVEAALVRGRIAALTGDFGMADKHFAAAQRDIATARARIRPETADILSAERDRLRLGDAWADIYTTAYKAQRSSDPLSKIASPRLETLSQSANAPHSIRLCRTMPDSSSEDSNDEEERKLLNRGENFPTLDNLRKIEMLRLSRRINRDELELLCSSYSLFSANSDNEDESKWNDILDKAKSISNEIDENKIIAVAILQNSLSRVRHDEYPEFLNPMLFDQFDEFSTKIVDTSQESGLSSLSSSHSVTAGLQILGAQNDLLDVAFVKQNASTKDDENGNTTDLYLVKLAHLRAAEFIFRESESIKSAALFARRAVSNELFRAADHYLTALSAGEMEEFSDPTTRANLIEVAADSIASHSTFIADVAPDLLAASIERLRQQADKLLDLALQSKQNLFYSVNIRTIGRMVDKVCPEDDVAALCGDLRHKYEEFHPATPLAEEDMLQDWANRRGVALAGLDIVALCETFGSGVSEDEKNVDPHTCRANINGRNEDITIAARSDAYLGGAAREGFSSRFPKENGPLWHFESSDHLAQFEKDPENYAPAIGGYDLAEILDDEPNLVVPTGIFSILRKNREFYFYGTSEIDFSKISNEALAYAKRTYRQLLNGEKVEKYEGPLPKTEDDLDAVSATAEAMDAGAADKPSEDAN